MKRIFLRGFAFVLPITLTIYLLYWLIAKAEATASFVTTQFGVDLNFPGSGLLLVIVFVWTIGVLSLSNFFNKLMSSILEALGKIPIVKTIFTPIRELIKFLGSEDNHDNRKVVLIDYNNVKCIGFVTNNAEVLKDERFSHLLAVYLPMSYAFGGYTVLVEKSSVKELDISVDKALKLAVTAWINKN